MSPRLSILMVTPRFEPHAGGVETHVREVGDRLVARGHQVTVLTSDAAPGLPADALRGGLRVIRLRGRPRGRDLRVVPGLPGALADLPADVVHVQGWHTLLPPIALAASQWLGRPTVLTFHSGGHASRLRERVRGIQLLALRPWLRRVRRLVAVSDWEAGMLAARLRLARDRFTVIPSGAELPAPEPVPARDPGLVVALGRLEAYKGHDRLVAALPSLRDLVPDARLRIAGAGPDEGRLRRLAERLGVADAVEIRGTPGGDRGAVADLLARAGVVALLSRYELQGLAAWEAAGAGAPLVVSSTTALGELVAAGLALGVRPGDAPAVVARTLADALNAAPGGRSAQGSAPERSAPEVRPSPPVLPTWDHATDRSEAIYRDLAAGPGRVR